MNLLVVNPRIYYCLINLKVVILGYIVLDKPEGGSSSLILCLINLKVVILCIYCA